MKIKCDDGIIREFRVCAPLPYGFLGCNDSICLNCKHNFDVHDTRVLKPRWKAHKCPVDKLVQTNEGT